MNDEIRNNILMLSGCLKKSILDNNKVMREFCSALLTKYLEEGIDVYSLVPKEELESEISQGMQDFKKRKQRAYFKRLSISLFTGIACGLFAYLYLRLFIFQSLMFFIVGFLGDYFLKIKVNRIIFVGEARREYNKYVDKSVLHIRESEDPSKLWK